MSRTKSIAVRRHRKTLKAARGFKQSRSGRIKTAKEAVLHAGQYAYIGRKLKKRDLKTLWIMRINAAARKYSLSYSALMEKFSKNKIELNRKMLAEMAVKDPKGFEQIVKELK